MTADVHAGEWSRVFTARAGWMCVGCDQRIHLGDAIQGRLLSNGLAVYRHIWCGQPRPTTDLPASTPTKEKP